ncbi:MAG: ArsR/SmtB family transcription factor [Sporichthyaceae bacterium]
MSDRHAKDALYDGFASTVKALANGRRVELVDVLSQGERSVEELAAEIGQSVANTSQHLRQLALAGLVVGRRQGSNVFYALSDPSVAAAWRTLRDLAVERLAQLDRLVAAYTGDRSGLETVGRAELADRLRTGGVLVLDVRPEAEFRSGHVPGARAVPPAELERRLADLPAGTEEVVAYCRGPFCVYADDAVRLLNARGRRARRLEDGFPEWAAAGLPVETGARTGSR